MDSKREKGSTPENMERAHHRNQRKSPMICPNCENCYEYMRELCLDNGELVIKKALKEEEKMYIERIDSLSHE